MATIFPNPEFDAEAAATKLKDAMDGLGTNEADIIQVMAGNSNEQRREIAECYKTSYGEDLIDALKSEIGDEFQETVVAMFATPRQYDARELNKAIKGAGTDEPALIEILVSRSNEEIAQIKEIYTEEFEANLEEDIEGDVGGNLKRFLVSLSNGSREDNYVPDEAMADEDAQKIYDAGENKFGTDESEFNKILCLRSGNQLRDTFTQYQAKFGQSIVDVINDETSGDVNTGYMAVVKCCMGFPVYFAERLRDAMAGAGTNDDTLIRIIVSRSETDLANVADAYVEMYQKSLSAAVADDCGGDYKRLLLAIIAGGASE